MPPCTDWCVCPGLGMWLSWKCACLVCTRSGGKQAATRVFFLKNPVNAWKNDPPRIKSTQKTTLQTFGSAGFNPHPPRCTKPGVKVPSDCQLDHLGRESPPGII